MKDQVEASGSRFNDWGISPLRLIGLACLIVFDAAAMESQITEQFAPPPNIEIVHSGQIYELARSPRLRLLVYCGDNLPLQLSLGVGTAQQYDAKSQIWAVGEFVDSPDLSPATLQNGRIGVEVQNTDYGARALAALEIGREQVEVIGGPLECQDYKA